MTIERDSKRAADQPAAKDEHICPGICFVHDSALSSRTRDANARHHLDVQRAGAENMAVFF
jgi:hypothetical protein